MVTATSTGATAGRLTRPGTGPFTRWPRTSDALLGALTFLLEVIGIVSQTTDAADGSPLDVLADIPAEVYLLLAVSGAALVWRRSHPLVVLTVTLAASILWDLFAFDLGPSLAILVSLYGTGRYVESRTSVLALLAAMAVVIADDLLESEDLSVVALSLTLVFVAWYLGRRVRTRREYLALLEERAEYLERDRAAQADRAVAEERTRIARELHDLVAHRVSMITVQAGAAQTVAGTDPGRALQAMEAVETEARQALDELRQILGVLRSEERTELSPAHGIADIPQLISEMRETGVDVSLTSEIAINDIPARIDLAAYRIVQEALTNVLKHAGPGTAAEVALATTNGTLSLEVTDRGANGTDLPGSGHGLMGMRERAALLGGSFEAGPRPGGGFAVKASLPLTRNPR